MVYCRKRFDDVLQMSLKRGSMIDADADEIPRCIDYHHHFVSAAFSFSHHFQTPFKDITNTFFPAHI